MQKRKGEELESFSWETLRDLLHKQCVAVLHGLLVITLITSTVDLHTNAYLLNYLEEESE